MRQSQDEELDDMIKMCKRLLLQANNKKERFAILEEARPTLKMARRAMTFMDRQDSPGIALEICEWVTLNTQQTKNSAIETENRLTILWTKAMKMQSKRPGGACKALWMYDEMVKAGVPMDIVSFNTAIAAAGQCGKFSRVAEIRQDMQSAGIAADEFTFSSLLGGCKTARNWKQAVAWFQELEESEYLQPNVFHYTTMMTILQRAGAWKESIEIFRKMEAADVKADVVCYNAAITACAKGADWQQAWAVFSAMRRENVDPNVISYNALLSACERCGQIDRAYEVFENMKRRGVRCNQVTYNTR